MLIRRIFSFAGSFLLLGAGHLNADIASEYAASVPYAASLNSTIQNNIQSLPTLVPNQNNPAQSQYYNNVNKMQADTIAASSGATANPVATSMESHFNSGPSFTINPNSPGMSGAVTAEQDAYNIAHGIPDKYNNQCQPKETCSAQTSTLNCLVGHQINASCTNTLNVSVDYSPYQFDCNHLGGSGFNPQLLPGPDGSGMCVTGFTKFYTNTNGNFEAAGTVNITLPPNVEGQVIMTLRGVGAAGAFNPERDAFSFVIHSNTGLPSIGIINPPMIDSGVLWGNAQAGFSTPNTNQLINMSYSFDLISRAAKGLFSFNPVSAINPAYVYVRYPFTKFNVPDIASNWVSSCPNLNNASSTNVQTGSCNMTQVCTDSSNPKIINGDPVTEPCWQYSQQYTCGSNSNTCNPGQLANCDQTDSACQTAVGGICLIYNNTYTCQTQQCTNQGMECGGHFFCLSGDCVTPTPNQNPNFGKDDAETAAVVNGMQDLINGNSTGVLAFTGTPMNCRQTVLNYINCCADSGWGKDLHLGQCSTEEKQLGALKEKGLAWDLGQYCSKKVADICVEHSKAYCTFGDQIAYDVQTQGRLTQLNRGFGSSQNPDCSGLSVTDLQGIDFNKINFSNVVQQIENNAAFPNSNQVQADIAQKIKQEMGGGA